MLRFSMGLTASHRVAGWGGGSGAAVLSFGCALACSRTDAFHPHAPSMESTGKPAVFPVLPVDFGNWEAASCACRSPGFRCGWQCAGQKQTFMF